MDKKQFEFLKQELDNNTLITSNDLYDKSDRTLLYGYTCNRDTWHVYLKDEEIYTVYYGYEDSPKDYFIERNNEYIPDKRLYPERCDYEFCSLLQIRNLRLPFTSWTDDVESKKYYGKIL